MSATAMPVILVMLVGRLVFSIFLARLLPIATCHVLHPFSIAS
jgi:hypothetical protein